MLTINLKHLYFFSEVARLGNVTAVAQAVHLTQPAITQAVANVECFFDSALLNRTHNGVTLTASGRICVSRIERALAQLHDGISEFGRPLTAQKRAHLLRSLSTSQVTALLAVVEHRNFSAASRAGKLSQPSIHRAARDLERLLEIALFERTSYGVVPTRAAERFARKARLAFAEISQARAEIAAANGGEAGRTVVGALPLARTFLLPNALLQFSEQFPRHQIEIVEGTYNHLLDSLRSGEVDFFIGAMRHSRLAAEVIETRLFDDPLSIILRSAHPLLTKRKVTARLLSSFPWVVPRTGSPLRDQYNKLFRAAGVIPPLASIECNSISAARALLLESDRIMLLSAHQVYYDLRAGLLKSLPPPGGKISRQIGMTWRRDWHPTKAQSVLLGMLKDSARNIHKS